MKIKKKSEATPESMDSGEVSGIKFYPMITAKDGAPNFAMRLFEIGPDGHSPKHTHDWEHEVFIVSGNGHVFKDGQEIPIEKDTFLLVSKGELHQFIAGDEGMSMICVVPNEGQPA
jgi:quercetin dioxygenase-like cupin family protein